MPKVFESGKSRLGHQAEDIAEHRKQYGEFKSDNKKRHQRHNGFSAHHQIPLDSGVNGQSDPAKKTEDPAHERKKTDLALFEFQGL